MAAFKNYDNGTWYVQFRYSDWKGERQQKLKRGFATKKEAQAWEREVGKSFFMAQLGYHVSGGLPLWEYQTHMGTVLYLALEDDYSRLQKRLSRMFGMDSIDNFHFATHAKNLKEGLDGQERNGIEWEQLGTHDEHLSVMDYKKVQRSKEVAALEKTIEKTQNKQVDIQAVEQIEVKNVPLSPKIMLEKEDYKTIVTAAQKYVVQVKKERKLEKLLQAAEKTIAGLKAEIAKLTGTIANLTRELDQHRAIRGQLSMGGLKRENEELRKSNGWYKSVIEQHDLAHLLGRNKDQRQTRDAR